ncbi:MAG: ABC transporter substrate-binding protein [Candidatus Binatia bacterium]
MNKMDKWIIGVLVFLFGLPQTGRGGTEDVLKSISLLSPTQRHEQLIKGAKKEGEVLLYSSSGFDEVKAISRLFSKKYPFIKIRYLKKGGSQLFKVSLLEFKSGKFLADVYWAGTSTLGPIIRENGMVTRYLSPERKAIPVEFMDKEGLWTGSRVSIVTFTYHAKRVPPDKVPKRYEDLLDPFWKGQLSVDTNPGRWTRVLVERMGWEKAEEFHRRLAAQKLLLFRGRTARTQLILAGETLGTLDINADNVVELKGQGAPVEYALLDPTIFSITSAALPKRSPHPNAAILLYDLIIGKDGQEELAKEKNVPVRRGVKIVSQELAKRYREIRAKKKFVVQSPGNYDPELDEKYDRLYIKTLVRKSR